jgi:DNA-binding NtrC family response regulator
MAQVVFVGLEEATSRLIGRALTAQRHQILHKRLDAVTRDLIDADIVFAGGDSADYLPLLRRVREARPGLPFVVVSGSAEIVKWLDALEAGATDYCTAPFETQQVQWVMESAMLARASQRLVA